MSKNLLALVLAAAFAASACTKSRGAPQVSPSEFVKAAAVLVESYPNSR